MSPPPGSTTGEWPRNQTVKETVFSRHYLVQECGEVNLLAGVAVTVFTGKSRVAAGESSRTGFTCVPP